MNREILFRGQRIDTKEWFFGDLRRVFYNGRDLGRREIGFWYENDGGCWIYRLIEVIPKTVGEFTGFNDKKGTKIFEGDVLKNDFDSDESIVEFDIAVAQFTTKPRWLWAVSGRSEVIGNIHEEADHGKL